MKVEQHLVIMITLGLVLAINCVPIAGLILYFAFWEAIMYFAGWLEEDTSTHEEQHEPG